MKALLLFLTLALVGCGAPVQPRAMHHTRVQAIQTSLAEIQAATAGITFPPTAR